MMRFPLHLLVAMVAMAPTSGEALNESSAGDIVPAVYADVDPSEVFGALDRDVRALVELGYVEVYASPGGRIILVTELGRGAVRALEAIDVSKPTPLGPQRGVWGCVAVAAEQPTVSAGADA